MFTIRQVEERDRQTILAISEEVGVFTQQEVAIVDELLQVYLYGPHKNDYTFIAAADPDDRVLGYVCFGPTPLTEGTFDIYWVAVRKAAQRQGIGRALLEWTEQQLRAQGARLLVLETSSTPEYAPTRKFYERLGYMGRT